MKTSHFSRDTSIVRSRLSVEVPAVDRGMKKSSSWKVASRSQRSQLENQIVWALFGKESGELIEDYSCAYEKNHFLLHGRMYITTHCLCFYSNLFGLEKKLRIPYGHIAAIKKKKTALVIDNAIAISTSR